jgi:8-oxo-dGTP pyrophosphatase MutT (NUDIX family)
MSSLAAIRRALAAHSAVKIAPEDAARAAVAVILCEAPAGAELLLIERAVRAGDPWSGHMAFPGGRLEPADVSSRAAAEREALEEVGIRLDAAEPLGRLDDKQGHPRASTGLVVSAYVYGVSERPRLATSAEVRGAIWFPVPELLVPSRQVVHRVRELSFPGILVGEPGRHVVWGLTYSFLESFFLALGQPMPDRWTPETEEHARGMPARQRRLMGRRTPRS